MAVYESLLRPLLFRMDPEAAHETAMRFLRKGILKARPYRNEALVQDLFGSRFENPLGLAAGFDKNAEAVDFWHQLGFGFAEVGTVTLHPQPGNDRPRLFRFPEDHALINRMGFNNDGAKAVAARLAEARPKIPIGINLGKSKVTRLDEAALDYQESFGLLRRLGAYYVVNVSSPNTPGLRDLQDKGPLKEIIDLIQEIDATRPLFIKVSPDLETSALDQVVEVAHEMDVTGLIATNTTLSRSGLAQATSEAGGLSGSPLRERADEVMRYLYSSCRRDMVLIGVGGIMSGDDLYQRIASGAHLCQIYTGWIYAGPHAVPTMLARLAQLMKEHGTPTLEDLRGIALAGR